MKIIKKSGDYELGYNWDGSNDGSAFGRNWFSTPVMVFIKHRSQIYIDACYQVEAGMARNSKDAESIARAFIRANDLRSALSQKAMGA